MNGRSDKLHTALLTLLRSGLWERELDNSSCFPLSENDWELLFRLSRQQTVTGIVFQGMHYLPDELLPSANLLIRWTAEVDAIEGRNRKMNQALSELYALFRAKDLNPVLQKGQGVAQFYPNPLLRECGDIDLYFNNHEAQEEATACIRSCGITVKKMPDESLFYHWKGIEVEHHVRLFDLYTPFLRRCTDRLEREKGFEFITLQDLELFAMIPAPFLNLLLLDLHILKHVLGWGIGLRQLCDMACACYQLHREVDPEEMRTTCRKLGLGRWNPLLHTFLTEHLGLPANCLLYPETAPTAQPLWDIVWRGGNFGYQLVNRQQAGQSAWKRKMHTASSFLQNQRFAFRYAPQEAFWIFIGLLKGQLK